MKVLVIEDEVLLADSINSLELQKKASIQKIDAFYRA